MPMIECSIVNTVVGGKVLDNGWSGTTMMGRATSMMGCAIPIMGSATPMTGSATPMTGSAT